MKRGRLDMDNEELHEYLNNLSRCIKLQYTTYKKRQRKFEKTLESLLPLFESHGHNPAVIRHKLSRLEDKEISANVVMSEDAIQLESVLASMHSKSPPKVYTGTYKELLEEIVGEKVDLPIPWLLDDTTPEHMLVKANSFKESLKQFVDSEDEVSQPSIRGESLPPVKNKVGRPKGSTNKEKFKTPPLEWPSEDEQKLLEKYSKVRATLIQSWGNIRPKDRRKVRIFGANSAGETSIMVTPQLEDIVAKAAEVLEHDQAEEQFNIR